MYGDLSEFEKLIKELEEAGELDFLLSKEELAEEMGLEEAPDWVKQMIATCLECAPRQDHRETLSLFLDLIAENMEPSVAMELAFALGGGYERTIGQS